jgi:hypothetical protein
MKFAPHLLATSLLATSSLKNKPNLALALATTLSVAALVGCGGGGGNDAPSDTGAAAAPASLIITGTAATGAAISGKTVEAKCAAAGGGTTNATTTTATTQTDGSFTLNVVGSTLPCMLQLTTADGTVLHSAAFISTTGLDAGGNTGNIGNARAVANITPVTQLITASLVGANPAARYASFDSVLAANLNSTDAAAAQAAVVAMLKTAGIDLTGVGELISAPLKAKTATTAGDTHDQALDNLAKAQADNGVTMAQFSAAAAGSTPAILNGAAPPSDAPSVPADLLFKPAASNCPALRSGNYRLVSPTTNATLADQFDRLNINASTLVITPGSGLASNWVANGACRYTSDAGRTEAVVSQAGVVVLRYINNNGSVYRTALAFPEQSHSLAELAGSWNTMGMQVNNSATGYTGITASSAVDSAGVQSSLLWCQNDDTWSVRDAACNARTAPIASFKINSTAGYDLAEAPNEAGYSAVTGRAFVYRSGNGDLLMVKVEGNGSFQLRTKQRTNLVPAVGAASTRWDVYLGNLLSSPAAIDAIAHTVVSTDPATQSWLRSQKNVGQNNEHVETIVANNPRNGYNFRAPGVATVPGGASIAVNEFTSLPLHGMGLGVLLLPKLKWFSFSLTQP